MEAALGSGLVDCESPYGPFQPYLAGTPNTKNLVDPNGEALHIQTSQCAHLHMLSTRSVRW